MGVLDLSGPAAPEPDLAVSADDVERELDALERQERSTGARLVILVISLSLFVSFHLVSASASGVAILVLVLFVHECGHWVAMKMSGYGDVQMFFVPFLGAAVSGSERFPSGTRRAIVALAGPIPGIALGTLCLLGFGLAGVGVLWDAARAFLALNAFNLLPILPLDGGRVVEALVFSRRPIMKAVFEYGAALALGSLAWTTGTFWFGVLALVMLLGASQTYASAKVAREIKAELAEQGNTMIRAGDGRRIPRDAIERLLPHVASSLPEVHRTSKIIAVRLRSVWSLLWFQPPSAAVSVALLALYAAAFIFGAMATLLPWILLSRVIR